MTPIFCTFNIPIGFACGLDVKQHLLLLEKEDSITDGL